MTQFGLLALVLCGTAVLIPVADRTRLPYPVLVTVFGLVLALVPTLPGIDVDPELILPLLLPPLLYIAARRTTWHQFAVNARPILLLAVALVFVTAGAVAAVASAVVPGLPLASAVVLGALVAPPDPVATSAVGAPLHLPRRMLSLLEGEGLFNDVTAIVMYHVAIAAVVTGSFHPARAVGEFALAAVIAVVIGYVAGWLSARLVSVIGGGDPIPAIILSLVVPAGVYVLADHLQGSGVLAVLVYSLYLSGRHDPDDVVGRLTFTTFWGVAEVAITGITFGVIGLELRSVLGTLDQGWRTLVGPTLLVVGTVVVVRLLWLLPVAVISRGKRRVDVEGPIGVRETLVMWWSGMRGVTTIVLALAIPLTAGDGGDFPGRAQILLIAFAVVMVTLVLQGLTLPFLVRMLGVGGTRAAEEKAERRLARRAAKAAIRRLDEVVEDEDLPQAAVERLREKYVNLLAMLNPDMWDEEQRENAEQWRHRAGQLLALDAQLLSAARQEIIDARAEPGIDPTVADRMLQRLDLQSMRGRR
ncbi:Na+/H+ antiporter [Actinophytocola xinjiangensis]|uniref:Na+/H+ antiporter n=1 Tax=Actinophytocola xinjiangensis TaxID=485602 RepID=A0A7Z0WPT9_9PSEU|nr:Na+/H+ antiporter [Actinophytocola xinjiangensis]OLF12043.1 Na+/H+ antiporter [Actinophytocola xinjiangensis]